MEEYTTPEDFTLDTTSHVATGAVVVVAASLIVIGGTVAAVKIRNIVRNRRIRKVIEEGDYQDTPA